MKGDWFTMRLISNPPLECCALLITVFKCCLWDELRYLQVFFTTKVKNLILAQTFLPMSCKIAILSAFNSPKKLPTCRLTSHTKFSKSEKFCENLPETHGNIKLSFFTEKCMPHRFICKN